MNLRKEPTKAFTLSVIAGSLLVCNAVVVGIAGAWFPWIFPTLPGSGGNSAVPFANIAVLGLICGALVLFGAVMLHTKPESSKVWGIAIIMSSLPSIMAGDGFIIGFILGIIGGVRALKLNPKNPTRELSTGKANGNSTGKL
ncbi:MAG: DUF6114 domain-containing protein [Candidatus Methanosuratincola sp.]